MLKSKVITKTVEEVVIEDVFCNKCGSSCMIDNGPNFKEFGGIIEKEVWGGYGSKLGDMTGYKFSLCETCLDALFNTFIIPVEMKDANWGDDQWISADKFEEHMSKMYEEIDAMYSADSDNKSE